MTQKSSNRLPTLFIPHGGGPCFFMEWTMGPADTWDKMATWLRELKGSLPMTPKAILVVSAHWENDVISVSGHPTPDLIYDYYGFPAHTYQLKYPAPGSPALAAKVAGLIERTGNAVRIDPERGFDHGVFIPFKLMFPEADIPIVQLSLQKGLDPALHLTMGKALEGLRDEGVLIVGSGMSYHNLPNFLRRMGKDSEAFDQWLSQTVTGSDEKTRHESLVKWSTAPKARESHPREEHLIPLMVVAGAAGSDLGKKVFSDKVMGAWISAFKFGG